MLHWCTPPHNTTPTHPPTNPYSHQILSSRKESDLVNVAKECAAIAGVGVDEVAKVLAFDLAEDPKGLMAYGPKANKLFDAPVDILINNGGISRYAGVIARRCSFSPPL